MHIVRSFILFSVVACALHAADPVADFKAAMAGDDFQAKRSAIQAVTGMPKDQDEQVLSMLVQAVSDRQAAETAVNALAARTGVQKPMKGLKGTGYPGYPADDSAGSWSGWLAAWKKDNDAKKKLQAIEDKAKELEKKTAELEKKDKKDEVGAEGDDAVKPQDKKPRYVEGQRGPRCRVHFKNGGSKVYYMLSKRVDANGNLLSVRVAYMDGGGNEVITADSISRLEEDVR